MPFERALLRTALLTASCIALIAIGNGTSLGARAAAQQRLAAQTDNVESARALAAALAGVARADQAKLRSLADELAVQARGHAARMRANETVADFDARVGVAARRDGLRDVERELLARGGAHRVLENLAELLDEGILTPVRLAQWDARLVAVLPAAAGHLSRSRDTSASARARTVCATALYVAFAGNGAGDVRELCARI